MSTTPPPTAADLLDKARELELTEASEVRAAPDNIGSPEEMARWLVEHGRVTAYQARLLLEGRGGELRLGGYRLLEPLGEGGMGRVFKARHLLLRRVVAIKIIRPGLLVTTAAARRFRREMRLAAKLAHPNVVAVLDAEEANGTHFLVTEFCPGPDLGRLVLKKGAPPVPTTCSYVRQAALGLYHAHEQGLVHRDVKPDNLLLQGAVVKVADFGLARWKSPDGESPSSGQVTREDVILGTPDYLAPEQALDARAADPRSDLYGLGCTLYHLLTGRVPFPGGDVMDKVLRHRLDDPDPVERHRPEVPPGVAAVVRRLMAKDPAERFATGAEVAAALGPWADPDPAPVGPLSGIGPPTATVRWEPDKETVVAVRPHQRHRTWLWAAVAGGIALVVAGVLYFR
jgi:serine/threonine-protein kinase